ELLIGSSILMKKYQVTIDLYDDYVKEAEKQGSTEMFIEENGQLTGMIAAADTLKDNAIEALDLLIKTGKELIILTGDNQRVADAIAQELGIDRVYAQVLPDEKQDKIEELQAEGK